MNLVHITAGLLIMATNFLIISLIHLIHRFTGCPQGFYKDPAVRWTLLSAKISIFGSTALILARILSK